MSIIAIFIFIIFIYNFFITIVGGLITSLFYERDKNYKMRYSLLITRNFKLSVILVILTNLFFNYSLAQKYTVDILPIIIKLLIWFFISLYICKRCQSYIDLNNQKNKEKPNKIKYEVINNQHYEKESNFNWKNPYLWFLFVLITLADVASGIISIGLFFIIYGIYNLSNDKYNEVNTDDNTE